jgi:hypothetical protein
MTSENNETTDNDITEKSKSYKPHQSYNSKDEINENNCKFKDGDILKFVRVRFPGHARSYPFLIGQRKLKYGQKVVAMSDRGMAVGYVNSFPISLLLSNLCYHLKVLIKLPQKRILPKKKKHIKNKKKLKLSAKTL